MRTETHLLLTGDYHQRLNALWSRALELERKEAKAQPGASAPRRIGELTEYQQVRDEYEALKAEAVANGISVTLQAVSRRAWKALREKHPPRFGDGHPPETLERDRAARVNIETVEDDLVRAALAEPSFESQAAFDEWAGDLSEADFQFLVVKAWEMGNQAQIDPKSLPGSRTLSSAESSG